MKTQLIEKEHEGVLYWKDARGNKWNSNNYTYEKAVKCCESMRNSHDCDDCDMCEGCAFCKGCSRCKTCISCSDCEHCRDCMRCAECSLCEGSSDCYACKACSDANNSSASQFSVGITNCTDTFNCLQCRNCERICTESFCEGIKRRAIARIELTTRSYPVGNIGWRMRLNDSGNKKKMCVEYLKVSGPPEVSDLSGSGCQEKLTVYDRAALLVFQCLARIANTYFGKQ